MTAAALPDTALAPVRARMLRDAQDQAAQLLAAAHREAAAISARARQDAAAVLAQAQLEGRQEAAARTAAERARGRARAAALQLRAQRAALDDLSARVRADILALQAGRDYGQLRDQLTRMARRAAGPGAVVTGAPDGGVLALGSDVSVDCSLTRLADLAVDALGPEVRQLWTR